jgi:hypothetical protein
MHRQFSKDESKTMLAGSQYTILITGWIIWLRPKERGSAENRNPVLLQVCLSDEVGNGLCQRLYSILIGLSIF